MPFLRFLNYISWSSFLNLYLQTGHVFVSYFLQIKETQANSPLCKIHFVRGKMELYRTYVSDDKCRGKLIGHISNSFERLIQSFKMENQVSEKYPPKRHDSSCVAVNIIPWTLLFISLFHWSPGVPIPISTNGSLKNSVKPSPNASSHNQLSVAVLIFLVALRDLSNTVSSSVSSS